MSTEVLSFAKSLIAIESVKEKPAMLKRVLEEALKPLSGFTIERFEKNGVPSALVYTGTMRPKRFKILLNAHLDVVPAKSEQFKPFEKGGKLWGRGSNDMKAAAAAEILVFKELAKSLPYSLGLQLVTDEEIGGHDGAKYQIEKGVRADFAIAGEPTDMDINNQSKGVIWAKINCNGTSAHGAYPWNGTNALWKAHRFLSALRLVYPVPTKEVWKTTVNVARIETSNGTFNKVPDNASIWLDIRYIPKDTDTVIDRLDAMLPEGTELDIIVQEPCQFTRKNNEYITHLAGALQNVLKKKPQIIVKHGAADIRHFNAVDCDGVTWGPVGAGLHTDNEWVSIKSMLEYVQALQIFLKTIS